MKKYPQILIVLLIVFAASIAVSAQKAARITLYGKATSATISGTLRGYEDKKVYVIRVAEGQTLSTEQIKAEASLRYVSVSIKNPAGEDVTDSDASCNNQKQVAPTVAGDYTITVYECQKADEWRGRFKLKVTVK